MKKNKKIAIIIFFLTIFTLHSLHSQNLKRINVKEECGESHLRVDICSDPKYGIVVVNTDIPDLQFRIVNGEKFLINFTRQPGQNRYILCVEPMNELISVYNIEITSKTIFTVPLSVSEIESQDKRFYCLVDESSHYVIHGKLISKGRNILNSNGVKLKKNEALSLMSQHWRTLEEYNKGLSRNKTGNILLLSGLCFSASGGYIFSSQPFVEYNDWIGNDGNEYYRYNNENLNHWLSVGFAGAGVAMMVTGIILKSNSKKFFRDAVNDYNRRISGTNMEWKFDYTGNGARLALTF